MCSVGVDDIVETFVLSRDDMCHVSPWLGIRLVDARGRRLDIRERLLFSDEAN